jgi:hypothetical protein
MLISKINAICWTGSGLKNVVDKGLRVFIPGDVQDGRRIVR